MRSSPNFITLAEVAERYGVSYITARAWAISRRIPAFQVGPRRRWRVDLDRLEEMERAAGERRRD